MRTTNGNRGAVLRNMRRALVGLVVLQVVYVALGNLILSTAWFEAVVNSRPGRVAVEWESMRTWFPGHVAASGLSIRAQSPRVQSLTLADRVSGWISPTALLSRTLRLSSVTISNLSSQIRSAQMLRKARPEEIRYFPVIPGFEPLAPQSPPQLGPFRPGWRMELGSVRIQGSHRVALGNYEFQAQGRVEGGMFYRIHGELEVAPTEFDLIQGRVLLNGEVLLSAAESKGRFEVHPFQPYFFPGLEKASFISFDSELTGRLASLDVLNFYLGVERRGRWPGFSAAGDLSGRLAVRRGKLTPDTDLAVDASEIRFDTETLSLVSSGLIRLGSGSRRGESEGLMQFELDRLGLFHRASDEALVEIQGLKFLVDADDAVIGQPLGDIRVTAMTTDSGVPDLRVFNQFIPSTLPVTIVSGAGELSGELVWEEGRMQGRLTVRSRGLSTRVEQKELSADITLNMTLAAEPESLTIAIGGSRLEMDRVIVDDGASLEPWSAQIEFGRGEIRLLETALTGSELPPLARLVDFTDGELELSGTMSNIDFLDYLLSDERRVSFNGRGAFEAKFSLAGGRIQEGSAARFESSGLAVHFLDFETRGHGRLNAEFVEEAGSRKIDIFAHIEDVVVLRDTVTDAFFKAPSVDVHVTGKAPDVTDPLQNIEIDLSIARAVVPDITVYNAYLPADGVLTLTRGDGAIRSEFAVRDDKASGIVELTANGVETIVNSQPVTVDLELQVRLADGDLKSRQFALDGSYLKVDNVRYPDGTTPGDWSTTISFEKGNLAWTTPLSLDANTRLDMTSSGPLIRVLAGTYSQFQWVDDLLSVNDVRGSGRLRLKVDSLILNELDIAGENIRISANLHIGKDGAKGIVYNRLGPFRATVAFDGEEREWFLFSARERFEAHPGY